MLFSFFYSFSFLFVLEHILCESTEVEVVKGSTLQVASTRSLQPYTHGTLHSLFQMQKWYSETNTTSPSSYIHYCGLLQVEVLLHPLQWSTAGGGQVRGRVSVLCTAVGLTLCQRSKSNGMILNSSVVCC